MELNIEGEKGWMYGSPLPKPMAWSRGVTVMSQFYITGKGGYHLKKKVVNFHNFGPDPPLKIVKPQCFFFTP